MSIYLLDTYLDILEEKTAAPANGVYYIQKQNNNFEEFQDALQSDLGPEIRTWGTQVFGNPPEATNLWMGDQRAVSSVHKDFYENLYCVLRGEKHFTLLPPSNIPFMYYRPTKSARYVLTSDKLEVVPEEGETYW